eukprot:Sro251_g099440.2  (111) ;mRNA; r:80313-80645
MACVLSLSLQPNDSAVDKNLSDSSTESLYYCSSDCAMQKGVPVLAKASQEWVKENNKGLVVIRGRRQDSFWQHLGQNETAKQLLRDHGWVMDDDDDNTDPTLGAKGVESS